MIPKKATYANPDNTYSASYSGGPLHYDFIFHRANHGNQMWTSSFEVRIKGVKWVVLFGPLGANEMTSLPGLSPCSNSDPQVPLFVTTEDTVSFSDHEAVTAKLFLKKPVPVN